MAKIVGTAVQPRVLPEEILPVKHGASKFPFRLQIHTNSWQWINGRWVPYIGKLHITPGGWGVPDKAIGKDYNTDSLFMHAERNGWKILKNYTDYLRSAPSKDGTVYFTKWDEAEVYGDDVEWTTDEAGLYEYVMQFVGNGHGCLIPEIPAMIKKRKINAFEKRVNRLETAHRSNPQNLNVKARYDEAFNDLALMKADLEGKNKPGPKSPSKKQQNGDETNG